MALKYIDQASIENKRVLARFDFNVPLDDKGNITDSTRVDRALETIQFILEKSPKKLILMSHLGRPKGKIDKKYSLEPVASYLANKLGLEVTLTESPTDNGIHTLLKLNTNKIILLENLRFDKRETTNDREFAKVLAGFGDLYINDAFGTAHRKHASTYGIIEFFKNQSFGGLLLKKECESLAKVVDLPAKPFVAILGGAKVSDKIKIIERLLPQVHTLLIGGAMSYPFLKALGVDIGKSLCSNEDIDLAKSLMKAPSFNKIKLPLDHVISRDLDGTDHQTTTNQEINADFMGLDIGPKTTEKYLKELQSAKTILWNGPMGMFENELFSKGTFEMAKGLAENQQAFTLVGGGDSVSAVKKSGLSDKIDHISTGGGASLEFLEQGTLPGIQALKFGLN